MGILTLSLHLVTLTLSLSSIMRLELTLTLLLPVLCLGARPRVYFDLNVDFKQCISEQRKQELLTPICTIVRQQAASLDKIHLTIRTPTTWSESSLMNLLDGVSKALLLGNIESDKVFSGTKGITISEARADRVSETITAKVW